MNYIDKACVYDGQSKQVQGLPLLALKEKIWHNLIHSLVTYISPSPNAIIVR